MSAESDADPAYEVGKPGYGGYEAVTELPRGGFVVATESAGNIQFVLPPETVKDTMNLKIATPEHYVFSERRFDKMHGINLGEFEFPTYFNFFIKRRQINLICTAEGEAAVRRIFQETLLGPEVIDNADEFGPATPEEDRPDLRKELDYFAHNPFNPSEMMKIDDLLRFTTFDDDGVAVVEGVQIIHDGENYRVEEEGKLVAIVPEFVHIDVERAVAASQQESSAEMSHPVVFDPPSLGVTMLGTSHGFDPIGCTTGMVVWINGRGVVVDPPPHFSLHLKRNHTPAALIDAVILSHCHADHDSGTFQRIIEETKVVVMTTPTIMNSFVRKYSAITRLPEDFFWTLFEFRPVKIGEPVRFRGGEFVFHYSLHSIPCIGFSLQYGGKSFIFSGDTCNDPERLRGMYEAGVLSRGRFEQLVNFEWQHDLILHEAGVPPIHTPLTTFHPLSDEIKHRLLLVHTAKKDVPPETGLCTASAGIEHTVRLDVDESPHREAIMLMDLLSSIDLFQHLPLAYSSTLLHAARRKTFEAEEYLVRQGEDGDTFFVMSSGLVCVEVNGRRLDKTFTTGDYFGEISVFSRDKRTASIIALTNAVIYEFGGNELFELLSDAGAIDRLRNVAEMRQEHSWGVIAGNSVLARLTSNQKTQLQGILERCTAVPGEALWCEGDAYEHCVLLDDAQLTLTYPTKTTLSASSSLALQGQTSTRTFTRSAFLCELSALEAAHTGNVSAAVHTTGLVNSSESDAVYFRISAAAMSDYLARNPGLKVALWHEYWLV
ncbi:cGMP-dependent 3',5'-cGMP phosphodiesterase A [Thecamonas trahens ATCC 50062]|uniref:cGMP-dependent 3',5'-cGMP phosphodiesterase A n=1 Tax=Thecamonas trahens ATCC 50062 TaxID=461836 RepID=A0A0L0DLA9_THETB|nr:cGMP-dependent 3',5'-cGMP phosphodiesterase A [Thecamonas trahens ATCC 50062]KNC52826.1 cGMP-dependent 3',5'-cGMP phosphodiesterase A [Thecamonas trahens ATCC 50062]|eukprot:XP_013754932.1 cGMP-dependent 3',5'-cGMP phosphodiesterase A [Thecamonas trahens ATCC 50062]